MWKSVVLCCLTAFVCTGCTRLVIPVHQIPFFLIDHPAPPAVEEPAPPVETHIAAKPNTLVLLKKNGSAYQAL